MMPSDQLVDVRDMLCAQALALVAKARASLPVGGFLDITYNAADVRHDLLAWAAERGDHIEEPSPAHLRIIRRQSLDSPHDHQRGARSGFRPTGEEQGIMGAS